MESSKIRETMQRTAEEIFQQIAFIFAEPAEPFNVAEHPFTGVEIQFMGPHHGTIHLWTVQETASLIAANVLGVDEDDPSVHEKEQDALKEFLNILAGNFLTTMFGTDVVFNLSIPSLLERVIPDIQQNTAIWLDAEENPVVITFDIDCIHE